MDLKRGQNKGIGRVRPICTPLIILFLCLELTIAKSMPVKDSSASSSSHEGSSERTKRQLFREQIPHHRPLSGNLYALHHGYPHPGRWHANQQQIVRPNYNSGLHFDNPNVIITDEDFNRYGYTLQHIDAHRMYVNPQPVLHEYPVEYGKMVEGGFSSGQNNPASIVAGHHHVNHFGNSPPLGQQYDHVEHGHAVVHSVGSVYGGGAQRQNYPAVMPTKSKLFFGFKIPDLLGSKMNFHPLLKGIWSGRYGSSGSSLFKRRAGPISWSAIEQDH